MAIVQQPTAISLSGNLRPFIVHKTELINFTLMDGDITLIEATYEPDSMGKVTIDVRDIIESRLKFEKKADAFYEQPEIVKQFTAIIDTDTVTFKVIRCEVLDLEDTPQNWLTGNFLTWQSQQKAVTYYSPEWLTYYATQQCNIKLKAQFPGEAEQNITLGSCQAGRAFTFNMQYAHIAGLLGHKYPSYYDVWAEDTAGRRLSYIQRYYHSEVKSEQEQWICFENSLGGIDTLRATGETDLESQSDHKTALIDGAFAEYKVDTKRVYTKNTGHLTDYERRWLFDFPAARVKYIYHAGGFRQIAVTDTSDFKYSISDLPSSFSFKYRFVNQSSALNLIRNQGDIPDNITIPDESAPDFFLPPRLSEFPRVALSEDTLIPAFDPHNLTPTVTTAGHIIQSAVAESLANIPGAGSGGTMVQVLTENSELAVTDRNVFSSKRTLKEIAKGLANSFEEFVTSMKAMFLRKDVADTAKGLITFLKGAMFGNFSSGIHTGRGARIDEEGNLEAQSAVLRSFLEVPSIKYNQLEVLGEETGIGAGGIIEEVDKITTPEGDIYRVKLKLKEGAANEFQRDDIVKGIFHQFEDLEEGELAGFQTSWFRVQSIDGAYMDLVMGADSEVPGGKNYPPRKFMNIAKRGNFTVEERQFSIILSSKTGNIVMYDGVDNYKSGTVVSQWGKPSGLEFIDGYQYLPINHDEALQYVKTLLVENIVRIDVNGVVKKEITDRGAWSLATAQSDEPYLNNEEHIHEAWHKAAKYRCIVNMTLNEPSPTSPDWIQIFEIEGVVSDGVRMKFIDSDSKPDRPVGDAPGWRNTPDKEDSEVPEPVLEPTGPNLYDAQYLINQGGTAVDYGVILNMVGNYHIINPAKLKANTQYSISYGMSGSGSAYRVVYNYTIGTPDIEHHYYSGNGNVVTDPNRTLQSVKIEVDGQVIVYTHPNIYELKNSAPQTKPVWKTQQSIVDGVPTLWSDPVRYEGQEGQGEPGETPYIGWNGNWWIGSTDTGVPAKGETPYIGWNGNWWIGDTDTGVKAKGEKGDKGDGITMKGPVENYAALIALPKANNVNGDARIVKIGSNSPTNDGHLWVWNTEVTPAVWFDTGKFQGQPGDKSYFHIAYCSYPERKVEGATAEANKIAMEYSQYADGRDYEGRKATHQGVYADWTEGGEDANKPWRWQEVKGEKGDKGDGITMKAPVENYAALIALPKANNVNGDARIVKIGSNSPTNDGHLWVWNTEVTPAVWFDTGKFQGQPGDKSYFHIAYCSYPDRKVVGDTAAANKSAMEYSQYADGREYAGRKATHQGVYADWTEGGEDANSPWKWQEVKGEKGADGTNFLHLGEWDEDVEYHRTAMGVPLVRETIAGSAFVAYTLHTLTSKGVRPSTSFSGPNRHWNKANTIPGLTYMENAYIDKLQAEIIRTAVLKADEIVTGGLTAQKIEALDIKTSNLEVQNGAKIGGFTVEDNKLVSAPSGKRVEIDPSNYGIIFKDANNRQVARLMTASNDWSELSFISYHSNGKAKRILNMSNVVGLIIEDRDFNGTPTNEIRYGSNGEIINSKLINMSDAQAANFMSGTFYRTGNILKVVP